MLHWAKQHPEPKVGEVWYDLTPEGVLCAYRCLTLPSPQGGWRKWQELESGVEINRNKMRFFPSKVDAITTRIGELCEELRLAAVRIWGRRCKETEAEWDEYVALRDGLYERIRRYVELATTLKP